MMGEREAGAEKENVTKLDSGLVGAPVPSAPGAREDDTAWFLNKEVGE